MEPVLERRPASFGSWLGFVLAAAAAVAALWFLERIVVAVLLVFFALVVSIALSAPVNWFVRRGL
jgi:predicted PurR-regulated permease PerM